ncbi:metallophosphoesterase [Burkholderia sp. PU8-34]
MKIIQFASDLHMDRPGVERGLTRHVNNIGADVLILAGDIHLLSEIKDICSLWDGQVVYVHGNHDLHGSVYEDAVRDLRQSCTDTNVHYLERGEWIYEGVRFLGCCLWTDYKLAGRRKSDFEQATSRASTFYRSDGRYFTARDELLEHRASARWLESKLSDPFSGKTIVVTHHAPHPFSLPARYLNTPAAGSYASDLSRLVSRADIWVHGHVHCRVSYDIAGCRILANPSGGVRGHSSTAPEGMIFCNPEYNPSARFRI